MVKTFKHLMVNISKCSVFICHTGCIPILKSHERIKLRVECRRVLSASLFNST